MERQQPRVPASCPPGFMGRYTVVRGDTMFTIAQRFRTTLPALIAANPHIPNPNVIFPGDVLCVPGVLQLPCCVVLSPTAGAPAGIAGAAFAHRDLSGTQAVGIIASLPLPSTLGSFDIYGAEVFIPVIGGFGFQLFKVSEEPPAWGGLISLPAAAFLTPGTRVTVRPGNSVTGVSGAIVLEGTLSRCFQR
ncbi:MAG: LysM peptidoglycan-binding domain-containing protein [Bacillota bacterium]